MILITGANGRVGSWTARTLLMHSQRVRILARSPEKAEELAALGAEIIRGDLADRSSIASALEGVDRALLVIGNGPQQFELESRFIQAATGLKQVVKISSMEASPDTESPIPKSHYMSECLLKEQLPGWTVLRPNFFMQNLLMSARSIAQHHTFSLPFGKARAAPIDTRDVAEIAAKTLMDESHLGQCYELTGPRLLNFEEIATRMSNTLGHPVQYVDQSPEDFRAFLTAVIPNAWQVNAVCDLFAQIANHALEHVSDDAPRLLGRPQRSLEQFLLDHAKAF